MSNYVGKITLNDKKMSNCVGKITLNDKKRDLIKENGLITVNMNGYMCFNGKRIYNTKSVYSSQLSSKFVNFYSEIKSAIIYDFSDGIYIFFELEEFLLHLKRNNLSYEINDIRLMLKIKAMKGKIEK